MPAPPDRLRIERNIRVHDRLAARYERTHDEIFNPLEQARLRGALERARDGLRTGAAAPRALDFGCGSGNLTRHLLALGFEVVAADVSTGFLRLVEHRHRDDPVTTHRLDGEGLAGLGDASFDLAAAFSVLHHIPDYLAAVAEMARVVRPGGILFIDHEHSPGYWRPDPDYRAFLRRARRFDWRRFLVPANYFGKLRRLLVDPRYANEGDIHVWPDDHIEWEEIERLLEARGFETLFAEDYLAFRGGYRRDVFEAMRDRCADMRMMAMRKGG